MPLPNPTVQRTAMVYTNTDTTLEKRDISEVIDLLDPFDTPILNMVGRDSLRVPCTQVKHEWITDRLLPRAGTLGAAYVAGSGTLQLASGEGNYLYVDDIILVDSISFRVVSGPPDVDILTVQVIAGTDTAIANATTWRKVSHAAQEGGSARLEDRKTVAEIPYNYTQIFKDWIVVSGTMMHIARYGYVNERAYQEEKMLKALALDLENTILYGARSYTGGPPRKSTMGGLFQYLFLDGVAGGWETVVDLAGVALTETKLNNTLEEIWQRGGAPDFIMVNSANKRRVTSWVTPHIRTTMDETRFGASIGTFVSDFGTLDIVLNRNLRASDIIIGTASQIGLGPLVGRQFNSRLLPATLDGDWYELLGEYTMEVHRPSVDFAWLYDSSTTL